MSITKQWCEDCDKVYQDPDQQGWDYCPFCGVELKWESDREEEDDET